jgi:hypothetical protein
MIICMLNNFNKWRLYRPELLKTYFDLRDPQTHTSNVIDCLASWPSIAAPRMPL